MKVTIVRGGGMAGVVETTVADTDILAADHADRLRTMVADACFYDLPGAGDSHRRGGPDRFSYSVTVADDERSHTVRRSEVELPAPLRELISWVGGIPGCHRGLEGLGG